MPTPANLSRCDGKFLAPVWLGFACLLSKPPTYPAYGWCIAMYLCRHTDIAVSLFCTYIHTTYNTTLATSHTLRLVGPFLFSIFIPNRSDPIRHTLIGSPHKKGPVCPHFSPSQLLHLPPIPPGNDYGTRLGVVPPLVLAFFFSSSNRRKKRRRKLRGGKGGRGRGDREKVLGRLSALSHLTNGVA
ncbi:hypothetical protein LX36DRAFT_159707 [Colletotrichum falcatum]|nr:hypothetical protein LX36DRAFT_159707 [Colletotrichum falcatum]